MSTIFERMRNTMGLGLGGSELYNRAFEKGVLLRNFARAAELFAEAASKFLAHGNQAIAAQAIANAKLYRYLAKGDAASLSAAIKALHGLQQIERIGLQHEMVPVESLLAELDCRAVEAAIALSQDDVLRLRDLHKLAYSKFQALGQHPLMTYEYVKSRAGHNERSEDRCFYHQGLYSFYEAMTRKEQDPAAAADDLALAGQAFRRCNDQPWLQKVTTLLETWRISRTCWLCHREVQGFELHFTMCRATITPYTQRLLENLHQDVSSINLNSMKIAVCTPCGSMITFKAAEEADKVRKELSAELEEAFSTIRKLEYRMNRLEQLYRARS